MCDLDGSFAENAVHRLRLRVYYEDTDAGGIVYHASYLRFMERGRSAMLRLLGYRHRELADQFGVTFAVRNMNIDFITPGRLDDALCVETWITDLGGASFTAVQRVVAAAAPGQVLASARVRVVAIGRTGRAARMPASVRGALAARRVVEPADGAGIPAALRESEHPRRGGLRPDAISTVADNKVERRSEG